MSKRNHANGQNRRAFLKEVATCGAFVLASNEIGKLLGQPASAAGWKRQIGLEMYTVRDLMDKDFEGTYAKVAEIGYKEVEPTGYGGLNPKQFRALLDRYGLTAPTTHAGATDGPGLEQQLEGHQIMGFKYTEITPARPAAAAGRGGRGRGGKAPQRPAETTESVRRAAAQYNKYGAAAKKFGMKILIHNHTQEFELLEDGHSMPYDILLAETDPALVTFQLDIGWAAVAGQNILQRFQQNPGRYELWHVKDAVGMKNMDPKATPAERRRASKLVPVGQGEIDWKAIFANAKVAGLKHFCIEQDNAAESGDSMGAAKASYQGVVKVLS